MICGPIVPNTLTSLRDLIVREVGRIEHGMRVLTDDLVLGNDAEVDALACDATGAPVLLFAAAPESSASLSARLLRSHSWMRDNSQWLAAELGDPGLRHDLPVRIFVIGLEVRADTVEELRSLELPDVTILQFCTFSLAGQQRLGVTEVPGGGTAPAATTAPAPAASAISALPTGGVDRPSTSAEVTGGQRAEPNPELGAPTDPFLVPSGIHDGEHQAVATRFLDLLSRVDPRMTATGDRFSRRLFLGGRLVGELGLLDGRLYVSLPPAEPDGEGEILELDAESCLLAVDLVIRMVLFLEVGESADAEEETIAPVAVPHPLAAVPRSADAKPETSMPRTSMASAYEVRPAPRSVDRPVEVPAAIPGNGVHRTEPDDSVISLPFSMPEPATPVAPIEPSSLFRTDPRPGPEEDCFSLEPIRRSVAQAQLSREEFSALGEDPSD